MDRSKDIIDYAAKRTDSIILFHSATGKDSIVLLDMLTKRFKKVRCYYMCTVPGMTYIGKYIAWAERKYKNCTFKEVLHPQAYTYIKYGTFGCKHLPDQKLYTLGDIDEAARKETGINWSCIGFKKVDSLNRRLMLMAKDADGNEKYLYGGVNEKTQKIYPLSDWKKADCLAYIKRNKLPTPVSQGGQSSGDIVSDPVYLQWLYANYPADLEKVFNIYPRVKAYLYEYQRKNGIKSTIR